MSDIQVESQEGLKLSDVALAEDQLHHDLFLESQEGLKRFCGHAWLEIVS